MTSHTKRRLLAQLRGDERGALLVMGIFMMLIAVAMLYVLIGTGQTLRAREGMQDAADASAFAAAVLMARGMNLIALINLLMALLVSILVAIRLTQTLFRVASIVLYSFVWYFGATAGPAAACQQVADQLQNVYDQAKDPIFEALEVMHNIQEGVSVVIPFVALGTGALEAAQQHPPAQGAFALPALESLPVESDTFPVLCGRATEMAVTGSIDSLTAFIPIPEELDDLKDLTLSPVSAAAEGIGQLTSGYLCGDGGSAPPEYKQKVKKNYPEPSDKSSCDEDPESAACEQATKALNEMKMDGATGDCLMACAYNDVYESSARQARRECEPRSGFDPDDFTWQEAFAETEWLFQEGQWTVKDRSYLPERRLITETRPPCGRNGSVNDAEWNKNSGGREQDDPNALCSEQPRVPEGTAREGDIVQTQERVALRLFSCMVEEETSIPVASEEDTFGGEDNDDKTPHRLTEDVELGDETFQVRALAFGPEVGPGDAMDGVRVALLGSEPKQGASAVHEISSLMSRFSFAQAEYYFDDHGDDGKIKRKNWLWEMRWMARLVRVRLPSNEEEQDEEEEEEQDRSEQTQDRMRKFGIDATNKTLESVCQAVTDQCPEQEDINDFASIILH